MLVAWRTRYPFWLSWLREDPPLRVAFAFFQQLTRDVEEVLPDMPWNLEALQLVARGRLSCSHPHVDRARAYLQPCSAPSTAAFLFIHISHARCWLAETSAWHRSAYNAALTYDSHCSLLTAHCTQRLTQESFLCLTTGYYGESDAFSTD
jgi:hypothetical protein